MERLIPAAHTGGRGKGRKIDRKRKRSQSHARYNSMSRRTFNKARRVRRCNSEAFYLDWCAAHNIMPEKARALETAT